jgi:hypothetical protein
VILDGDEPLKPLVAAECSTRIDDLAEAIGPDGIGGRAEQAALEILDERLASRLAELAPGDLLLLSGGPTWQDCPRVTDPLDLPGLTEAGFRLRVEDAFALCEPTASNLTLPSHFLDEWLARPGVERILAPDRESAGSWYAPSDRGWIIVAEPGTSFRPQAAVCGHREPARPEDASVLLAFGPAWPGPWPDTVHDWRVAPTLLAADRGSAPSAADLPLPGSEALAGS